MSHMRLLSMCPKLGLVRQLGGDVAPLANDCVQGALGLQRSVA